MWFLEKNLTLYFTEQKYHIDTIKKPNDNSIQVVVHKNGQKTVILGWIGTTKGEVQLIKDAVKAKGYFNCLKAIVVINGKFTKEAQNLARLEQIEVWDNKKTLKNLLSVHNKNSTPLKLPGTEDLEKTLTEISSSLGIDSKDGEK